ECTFTNNYFGLKIENSLQSSYYYHLVHDCTFDNIPGGPWKGAAVYISKGGNDVIRNNTFGPDDLTTPQTNNATGIFAGQSWGLDIVDNDFYHFTTGISVSNSQTGSVYIGNFDDETGNRFFQCKTDIVTSGTNNGLKTKCNYCSNTTDDPNIYSKVWYNTGQIAAQGDGILNTTQPAGNKFDPYNDNALKKIVTNSTFVYYHHNSAPYTPWSPSSLFYPVPGPAFVVGVSCQPPVILPAPVIIPKLDSLENELEELNMACDALVATLDKGYTEQLVDALQNNLNSGPLKNLLVSKSPLSDTVLVTLFNENTSLSPGNFKNVMNINLPVSDEIVPDFNEKLTTLPPGIAGQLKSRQGLNPGIITPTTIIRQIEQTFSLRQRLLSDLLRITAENDSLPAIIDILENETSLTAKQMMEPAYIDNGDFASALAVLNELPLDEEDFFELNAIYEIMIDILGSGKMLCEMDGTDRAYIEGLADSCDQGRASVLARAVMTDAFNVMYPLCEPDTTGLKSLRLPKPGKYVQAALQQGFLIENYPDPFSDVVFLHYVLPCCNGAEIKIYDPRGRIIAVYPASEGNHTVEINTGGWAGGVYTYTLTCDGVHIRYGKMVLIK
ncbi:MAG: T9SS type A sorting domain-containing protein, partial [Bacteroidetes bacterium]|nr:T9SS type A sorting domain-containing protein [Bacteroidota bacterium]